MIRRSLLVLFVLIFANSSVYPQAVSPAKLQALQYRNIGPIRGGRSTAVAGIPDQPYTFFMGTAGGLWRTTSAGQSWENVSDGFFESGSIGAIAVAGSNVNVIYAGTGQACLRGNVAAGVGVYKSTDGGKTWKHSGLRNAGQIARIRVHPKDENLVYVAVLGNAFTDNEDRGVFRSRDGGATWQKVLYVSPKTGAADLAMDLTNPRVLYAALAREQRKPWTIISGNEEGGIFKTVDGGDTWTKLAGGLPQGTVGRIGVAVSPANPDRLWALVEAENGGLFRSDDAGKTWTLLDTNAKRSLIQRAWYYMHIIADPRDPQKVYVLNVDDFVSKDGGKTFEKMEGVYGDAHDLWINPNDTRIMILGDDGGVSVTLDAGKSWSTELNQPTAEIYNVAVDESFPYRVYGGQQDNTTISLPSRELSGLSPYEHWRDVGGCEDGQVAPDPRNPDIVYAGCYGGEISRTNYSTGEIRSIMTYPEMEIGKAPKDLRYRFNWNAPIRVSKHDPRILYHASQYIHRSTDEGQSWEIISPDLSRDDKSKEDYAGEPVTYENTGVEVYANVLSFEESPVRAGVLWAGSDDGLVHVSDDDGKSWRNVTPAGMPEWGIVNSVEPSPQDPARTLIAVHKYMLGDPHPYLFRTNDSGKTWTLLTDGKNGIPATLPTRVVREDPMRKGLLYAGTESGVFVSFDDGRNWQSLQLNLPVVPVTDIRVHHNDLVVSTQGRSFWILDDLTLLHQIATGAASGNHATLFKPRDAYRMKMEDTKANPPNGVLIFYYLPEEPKGEVTVEISDSKGELIQHFSSDHRPIPNPEFPYKIMGQYNGDRMAPKKAGLNRFVWDLRYPPVDIAEGAIVWGYVGGPKAAPGTYNVTVAAGDWKQTQSFHILKDPRVAAGDLELQQQFDLMWQIRNKLNELYHGVKVIRSVRQQASDVTSRLASAGKDVTNLKNQSDVLSGKLNAIEEALMQPRNQADQDTENFPTKLDNQLSYISIFLNDTDSRPTEGQRQRVDDLCKEIDAQLTDLKKILDEDVATFNRSVTALDSSPVLVPGP
jgi:photosystem II stability/assembly factor-like uncharacterized protein